MSSKPSIALLHGWATNPNIWEPVATELQEKGFSTTIYAMAGYGGRHADEAKDSFNQHVQDAIQRLSHCSIWVGWSLGSMIALAAAASRNSKIRGLFIVSGTAKFCFDDDKTQELARLTQAVEAAPQKAVTRFIRSMPSEAYRRKLARELTSLADAACKDTLLNGLDLLSRADLSNEVNKIGIPVRILSGSDDLIIPAQSGSELQQLIPHSQFTALPCGHIPFLECPVLFMEQLFEFAETIAQSQTG